MINPDPVSLSALNDWAYCSRRYGLTHMEDEFTDNIYTARGNTGHDRMVRVSYETAKSGARVGYALPSKQNIAVVMLRPPSRRVRLENNKPAPSIPPHP